MRLGSDTLDESIPLYNSLTHSHPRDSLLRTPPHTFFLIHHILHRKHEATMRSFQMERMRSLSDLPKLHEFERAVQMELAHANGREEMFLRSSSGLSTLFKSLGHEHGRPYFRYVLRDVFGEKSTLYHKPTSPAQVREYAKSIIERLVKAIHFAPLVLRAVCHLVLKEFQKAFPESTQGTRIVIGGVLFLRIVCPALIKPEILGFPPHNPKSLPVGLQIAKMLQHTLNGGLLSDSQPEFAQGNVFISTFQPHVASFLARFPQVRSSIPQESPRPAEVLCVKPWDMESAPPTPNSWEPHPSKLRGMSISTVEPTKPKRKFSFRFWNRMPASSMSS